MSSKIPSDLLEVFQDPVRTVIAEIYNKTGDIEKTQGIVRYIFKEVDSEIDSLDKTLVNKVVENPSDTSSEIQKTKGIVEKTFTNCGLDSRIADKSLITPISYLHRLFHHPDATHGLSEIENQTNLLNIYQERVSNYVLELIDMLVLTIQSPKDQPSVSQPNPVLLSTPISCTDSYEQTSVDPKPTAPVVDHPVDLNISGGITMIGQQINLGFENDDNENRSFSKDIEEPKRNVGNSPFNFQGKGKEVLRYEDKNGNIVQEIIGDNVVTDYKKNSKITVEKTNDARQNPFRIFSENMPVIDNNFNGLVSRNITTINNGKIPSSNDDNDETMNINQPGQTYNIPSYKSVVIHASASGSTINAGSSVTIVVESYTNDIRINVGSYANLKIKENCRDITINAGASSKITAEDKNHNLIIASGNYTNLSIGNNCESVSATLGASSKFRAQNNCRRVNIYSGNYPKISMGSCCSSIKVKTGTSAKISLKEDCTSLDIGSDNYPEIDIGARSNDFNVSGKSSSKVHIHEGCHRGMITLGSYGNISIAPASHDIDIKAPKNVSIHTSINTWKIYQCTNYD